MKGQNIADMIWNTSASERMHVKKSFPRGQDEDYLLIELIIVVPDNLNATSPDSRTYTNML